MRDGAPHDKANALLAILTNTSTERLKEESEIIFSGPGAVLADPERPVSHVYFPTTGVISILSVMTDRSAVETAVVGYEGMAPIAPFHGVNAGPEQTIVQVPGEMVRLTLKGLERLVNEAPEFNAALHRYSLALFSFAAQTSACNRRHSVIQRCARWLLQTHDRVRRDEFQLTHLFLSQMLGVRRSSVTVAAESLRSAGAISYTRGSIRVVDREKLEALACECYAIIRTSSERVLRTGSTVSPLESVEMSKDGQSLATSMDRRESGPVSIINSRVWQARLDFFPDGFLESDEQGRILEVNRAAEQLFGRGRDHLVGSLLIDLIVDEDRQDFRQLLDRVQRGGEDIRWRGRFRAHNSRPAVEAALTARAFAGSSEDWTQPGVRYLLRERPGPRSATTG